MTFSAPRFPHSMFIVRCNPTDIAHLQHIVPGAKVYSTRFDYTNNAREWTKGGREPGRATVYASAAVAARVEACLDHWGLPFERQDNWHGLPSALPQTPEEKARWEREGRDVLKSLPHVRQEWCEWASPYQAELVGLVRVGGWRNLLLNWKAGSGKTIGSILAAESVPGPKIYVVPSKVRPGWSREVEACVGEKPFVCMPVTKGVGPTGLIHYLRNCKLEGKSARVVVGIEYLSYWAEILKNAKPTSIIIDEVDLIANAKTTKAKFNQDSSVSFNKKRSAKNNRKIRSVSVRELRDLESVELCMTLTATPIYDGVPKKFFPVADLTWPYILGFGEYHFGGRYCGGKRGEYGLIFPKGTNIPELKRLSTWFMHRVTSKEALAGLPEISYKLLYVKKENQTKGIRFNKKYTYNQALAAAHKDPEIPPAAEIRSAYVCELARDAVIDEAVAEVVSGGRCFIMVERIEQARIWYEKIAKKIDRRMNKGTAKPSVHLAIGEGMTPEERYEEINRYNSNPSGACMVGTRHAMGQGVDGLQQTTLAIIYPPPNAAMLEQAMGRFNRKGRKVRTVIRVICVEGSHMEDQLKRLGTGLKLFGVFFEDSSFSKVVEALESEEASVEDAVDALFDCCAF